MVELNAHACLTIRPYKPGIGKSTLHRAAVKPHQHTDPRSKNKQENNSCMNSLNAIVCSPLFVSSWLARPLLFCHPNHCTQWHFAQCRPHPLLCPLSCCQSSDATHNRVHHPPTDSYQSIAPTWASIPQKDLAVDRFQTHNDTPAWPSFYCRPMEI